jgi:hypothetical protein
MGKKRKKEEPKPEKCDCDACRMARAIGKIGPDDNLPPRE